MTDVKQSRGKAPVSGPLRVPTIQIHPTRRCNLICQHCYSNSGPRERAELDVARVCQVIDDAAAMGYEIVSFSGGEPLLYKGIIECCQHAHLAGMRTAITTNGSLLTESRIDALSKAVDLVAISLDGPPALHNRMRGSLRSFDQVVDGARRLREAHMTFGFIHTLTRHTWEHLVWLADFAASAGASLFQIHPLELAGRAVHTMSDQPNDENVLAKAYLLTLAIARKYAGSMSLQLDVLHREDLLSEPELGYADPYRRVEVDEQPSSLLGLLVVETDGSVVPISYGFSRDFEICNLYQERLPKAWPRFVMKRYQAFRTVCRDVFDAIAAPTGPELFNWHERVIERSGLRPVRVP